MPPSSASAFFSTVASGKAVGSNVFLVILVDRHRRLYGPQDGKQPARARRRLRTHAGYATPASRAEDPVFVIAVFARSGPDSGDATLKPSESA